MIHLPFIVSNGSEVFPVKVYLPAYAFDIEASQELFLPEPNNHTAFSGKDSRRDVRPLCAGSSAILAHEHAMPNEGFE